MPLLKNKTKNQLTASNTSYWKDVEQKAHALIADILKEKLPLTNPHKNLDLSQDEDYLALLPGYQEQYSESLPDDSGGVAHEITYEYLLIVIKSLTQTLKTFTCHDSEYFENLIS